MPVSHRSKNTQRVVTRATVAASTENLPTIRDENGPFEPISVFISNLDLLKGNCMNGEMHPSRKLSREATTEEQRQNINVRHELAEDIDKYLR